MKVIFSKTVLCCWIFIPVFSFCQESPEVDVRNVTRANFFDPGFSLEKRIGNLQTLYTKAFLSTSIYIGYSSSLGNTSGIDIYPAFTLQYRYYYNGNKRESKGKRIAMNSMNYISFVSQASYYKDFSWGQNESRILKTVGTTWGFQRNFPKRFGLDFNIGLGYSFSKKTVMTLPDEYSSLSYGELTSIGHITLGFWLNKEK